MPDPFLPLQSPQTQPDSHSPLFQPKILPSASSSTFSAFPTPHSTPSPPAPPHLSLSSASPKPPTEIHSRSDPVVTLERDGDKITCIRVQCTCGHLINLACLY